MGLWTEMFLYDRGLVWSSYSPVKPNSRHCRQTAGMDVCSSGPFGLSLTSFSVIQGRAWRVRGPYLFPSLLLQYSSQNHQCFIFLQRVCKGFFFPPLAEWDTHHFWGDFIDDKTYYFYSFVWVIYLFFRGRVGAEGGERILSRICAELDPDLGVQGSRSHDCWDPQQSEA